MKAQKIMIIIPARYHSTRLPGKPLKKIAGVEMIRRVAMIAAHVCRRVDGCGYLVATDGHPETTAFCNANHIPNIAASENCKSGTERCYDAVQRLEGTPELIVNLQGDNPLCPPWFIEQLIEAWRSDSRAKVFTPCLTLSWAEYDAMKESKKTTPFSGTTVLVDKWGYALAFSKTTIPAVRNEEKLRQMSERSPVRRHIGLYAYTNDALRQYFELEPSPYESCEGLEQMRFLHHRIPVRMVEADYRGRRSMSGVDSPEDIGRAENIIAESGEFDLTV